MTDPTTTTRRVADVRVGSSTDGLSPISVAERRVGARLPDWLALAAVAGAAIAADQITKQIVAGTLALGESKHVLGPLDLHHVQNSGIAFGLFQGATPVVIGLTSLVVVWLLLVFARSGARHPVMPVGLGLVIGGSVSNLADRVRLGHVTDFLDVDYWPAFNLADMFIVAGVGLLISAAWLADRSRPRPR